MTQSLLQWEAACSVLDHCKSPLMQLEAVLSHLFFLRWSSKARAAGMYTGNSPGLWGRKGEEGKALTNISFIMWKNYRNSTKLCLKLFSGQTNFPIPIKGEKLSPKNKEWITSPGSHTEEGLEDSKQTTPCEQSSFFTLSLHLDMGISS